MSIFHSNVVWSSLVLVLVCNATQRKSVFFMFSQSLICRIICKFIFFVQSRRSPFANSKTQRKRSDSGKKLNGASTSKPTPITSNRQLRWYSLIDAAMQQKRAFLPVEKLKDVRMLNKELHRTLYGFIVFEVEWANVRGINYLNELQVEIGYLFIY